MTREEAKEKLKDILAEATEDEDAVCYVTSDDADVLKVAIQALEQEPILEKIREEIEQLRLHKAEFLTSDSKVCIDSQAVLDILDKYEAEREEDFPQSEDIEPTVKGFAETMDIIENIGKAEGSERE